MATHYAVVNILKYENGKLYYSDNEDGWAEVGPDTNTGDIKQCNLILWYAGKGISMITDVSYDEDFKSQFAVEPKPKLGGAIWFAKLKDNARTGTEMKYSISFRSNDGKMVSIDPKNGSIPGP